MAALTNKVWSCSSDCVMVQHPWSLYFFRLAVFSLADSGVSNLPTRFSMVAPRKTAPDDLHSSALTTSSRDARKWANSRSWMSSYITAESCLGNNGRSIGSGCVVGPSACIVVLFSTIFTIFFYQLCHCSSNAIFIVCQWNAWNCQDY
jgi:hypothetical protein